MTNLAIILVGIAVILNSLSIIKILKKDELKIVGSSSETRELIDLSGYEFWDDEKQEWSKKGQIQFNTDHTTI